MRRLFPYHGSGRAKRCAKLVGLAIFSALFGVGIAGLVPVSYGQINPQPESGLQVSEGRANERFPTELQLPPPIVTSQTQFEIPFRTDDVNGRLVEVQLYVSTDLGVTWNVYARQSPATTRIPFQSVGDGEYLFALKTLDRDGRLLPTGPPIPTLRMLIDTVQPELNLSVEPDKLGRVAITWLGTDPNLNKGTLRLSYRLDGANLSNQWFPLATGSPATSEHSADPKLYQDRVTWFPDSVATAIVLKAEIQDHAGNTATTYQPMSLGNLRSAAPGPILQGGQTSVLTPPNPQAQSTQPSTIGSAPTNPQVESNTIAALDPSTPIDWPASNQSNGGQTSSVGGQTNSGTPAERVNAQPANWSNRSNGPNRNSDSIAPNPTLDPFRQPITSTSETSRSDYDANLASQNLAVAVGTTLRQPLPGPSQDQAPPGSPQVGGQSPSNGGQTPSNGGKTTTTGVPVLESQTSTGLSMPNRNAANVPVPAIAPNVEVTVPNRTPAAEVTVPNRIQERSAAVGISYPNQPKLPPAKLPTESQAPTTAPSSPATNPSDSKAVRFSVNTLQFRLRYQIDGLQLDRIAAVSIFGSRDKGQTWELWTEDRDKTSPVEISVPNPGEYAFRVVITSNTGSTSYIPRPGDAPEIEVNVDRDLPSARITAAPYGHGTQPTSLIIQWTCSENDLASSPISLAYSHAISGPWTTITTNAPNTGQFEWSMQPNLPNRVYLQITATDLAGNQGQHILETPIDIGPLLPRGRILGLDR